MGKKKISPSMMCAGILNLENVLREFEQSGTEYLHIDIMDGHFVPNYTLGTDYCRNLKKATDIPLDIHLMVEKPEKCIEWFDFGENDIVSVHMESTEEPEKCFSLIRKRKAKAFAVLNPATPVSVLEPVLDQIDGVLVMCVNPGFAGQKMVPGSLEKICDARNLLAEKDLEDIEIEVDGNVSFENAVKMSEAGADIFVAGSSSVFSDKFSVTEGMNMLRKAVERG